jgi:uncharacterized coiled-coil DUF342 family protein
LANIDSQPNYDKLLKLYGESMLRVGQLEARVATLNEIDSSTQADNGHSREIIELTERVDAIHGLITGMSQEATNTADLGPADGHADEIAQMRVQITSLVNQLDGARNELNDYRARRRRRSQAPEHTPLLQSIARRLGISRPQRM